MLPHAHQATVSRAVQQQLVTERPSLSPYVTACPPSYGFTCCPSRIGRERPSLTPSAALTHRTTLQFHVLSNNDWYRETQPNTICCLNPPHHPTVSRAVQQWLVERDPAGTICYRMPTTLRFYVLSNNDWYRETQPNTICCLNPPHHPTVSRAVQQLVVTDPVRHHHSLTSPIPATLCLYRRPTCCYSASYCY